MAKKRYSITHGQYKRMMREGAARECTECHHCLPKYQGRYPKHCPECGGGVGMPIDEQDDSDKRHKRFKKRTKVGAAIGATVGGARGAAIGGARGAAIHAFQGGKNPVRHGVSGALAHGAVGALGGATTGAGVGAGYHAYKERKKKKKKLRDSLDGLLNGQPLNYVIDELLQPKNVEPSQPSSKDVD